MINRCRADFSGGRPGSFYPFGATAEKRRPRLDRIAYFIARHIVHALRQLLHLALIGPTLGDAAAVSDPGPAVENEGLVTIVFHDDVGFAVSLRHEFGPRRGVGVDDDRRSRLPVLSRIVKRIGSSHAALGC